MGALGFCVDSIPGQMIHVVSPPMLTVPRPPAIKRRVWVPVGRSNSPYRAQYWASIQRDHNCPITRNFIQSPVWGIYPKESLSQYWGPTSPPPFFFSALYVVILPPHVFPPLKVLQGHQDFHSHPHAPWRRLHSRPLPCDAGTSLSPLDNTTASSCPVTKMT